VVELKAACAECARNEIAPVLRSHLRSAAGIVDSDVLLDEADRDGQTLLVRYKSVVGPRPATYIMPSIRIELGGRSGNEPVQECDVRALIDEVLPGRAWAKTARVRALDPRRTFMEKAFLVHEEIHRPEGKSRRARLSRHLYDLSRLMQAGVGGRALKDKELFQRVLKNRRTLFGYAWIDYSALSAASLDICPPEDQVEAWRSDYDDLRREMIYGTAADFPTMVAEIRAFKRQFMTQGV
jgi:hypothetical protein